MDIDLLILLIETHPVLYEVSGIHILRYKQNKESIERIVYRVK